MKITYKSNYHYKHNSGNISMFIIETANDFARCITYNPTTLMVVGFCASAAAERQWKKLCSTDHKSVKRNRSTVTVDFTNLISFSFPEALASITRYWNTLLSDNTIGDNSNLKNLESKIINGLKAPTNTGGACTERYKYANVFGIDLASGKELLLVEWVGHHSFISKRGEDKSQRFYDNGGDFNGKSFQGPAAYFSKIIKAVHGAATNK